MKLETKTAYVVFHDDHLLLPGKWTIKYCGVHCCRGHYRKSKAIEHAYALFSTEEWSE